MDTIKTPTEITEINKTEESSEATIFKIGFTLGEINAKIESIHQKLDSMITRLSNQNEESPDKEN